MGGGSRIWKLTGFQVTLKLLVWNNTLRSPNNPFFFFELQLLFSLTLLALGLIFEEPGKDKFESVMFLLCN
jgi:hypothetical protein